MGLSSAVPLGGMATAGDWERGKGGTEQGGERLLKKILKIMKHVVAGWLFSAPETLVRNPNA